MIIDESNSAAARVLPHLARPALWIAGLALASLSLPPGWPLDALVAAPLGLVIACALTMSFVTEWAARDVQPVKVHR